jgi:glucokinase
MNTHILAIDIGGTNTKLALIDSDGNAGQVSSIPTSGERGLDYFLRSVTDTAHQMINQSVKSDVVGVGIGVAGFVDPAHTQMVFNPNITWLEGANLKDHFSSNLNLPVYLEIDSNAAALAEAVYGNGKGSRRLLVLTVGTGLGGGMTVDGKILRIANECLGDIGHVMVEPGGPQCLAGCRGCAEAMVSVSALEKYALEFMSEEKDSNRPKLFEKGEKIHTPEIIKAAQQGNRAAEKAIQKLGRYLGIALASMAPVLAPDRICIAGGISEAGPLLLEATRTSFLKIAGPPYAEGVTIQKASLGWRSVLVGAAEAFKSIQNLDLGFHAL